MEEVAEQHAHDGHADPEDDVDEGHREVRLRDLRAVEAAIDDEREQRYAEQTREPFQRARQSEQPAQPRMLQLRARHIVESATNETTSTIAAVQLNSHTGIGRSALPTIPWA